MSFGACWNIEGLGGDWPQSNFSIVLLATFYGLAASIVIGGERRAAHRTLKAVQQ